jgi:hypothetical protein
MLVVRWYNTRRACILPIIFDRMCQNAVQTAFIYTSNMDLHSFPTYT